MSIAKYADREDRLRTSPDLRPRAGCRLQPARGLDRAYDHRSMFHESARAVRYLAAITTRVKLATSILVLRKGRRPCGEASAEVDVLRAGASFSCWHRLEHGRIRGIRMSFTIVASGSRSRSPFWHCCGRKRSRTSRVDGIASTRRINPLPLQWPIPIWMGEAGQQKRAITEPALRRIAKIADGWFTHLPTNETVALEWMRPSPGAEEGRDRRACLLKDDFSPRRAAGGLEAGITTSSKWGDERRDEHDGCRYRSIDEHLDALAASERSLTDSSHKWSTVGTARPRHPIRSDRSRAAPRGSMYISVCDTYGAHEHGYTKLLYCTPARSISSCGRRSCCDEAGRPLVLPPRTRHSAVVGQRAAPASRESFRPRLIGLPCDRLHHACRDLGRRPRSKSSPRRGRSRRRDATSVHLEIGEPDFDTPPADRRGGVAALERGETHYTQSAGVIELREAIALYPEKRRGVRADPGQVIVTPARSRSCSCAASRYSTRATRRSIRTPASPFTRR